jgi:S1-C subfamily serine protease
MKMSLIGFALLASVLHAGPGFYPLTDPSLPPSVVASARNAVRIFVFNEHPSFAVLPESIELLRTQMLMGDYSTFTALDICDPAAIRLYRRELAKHRPGKAFHLHKVSVGTGFFITGERFVTARHVLTGVNDNLRPYNEARHIHDARRALAQRKSRIVLEDADGNVLFDTNQKGQMIKKVHFSGHALESSGGPAFESSVQWQANDYAVIEFSGMKADRRVVPVADQVPSEGATVYAAGFPMPSRGRRRQFSVPDSDGTGLRVSRGLVQAGAPELYLEFLRARLDYSQVDRYQSVLLFSDLDFVPGLSGGPVLNEDGKVVSIVSTVRNAPGVSPLLGFTADTAYGPRLTCASLVVGKK